MKVYKSILLFALLCVANSIFAQRYFSKTGEISFLSETPIENIAAVTNSASTVIDLSSGKIQWAVLIKSFEFEKALMQEHFNENYMESSEFPKAKFTGTIENPESLNFNTDGSYTVNITGALTIHGVTQQITTQATFEVSGGSVKGMSTMKAKVADYGIEIPAVVNKNIASEIDITITANYELLKK